MINQDFSFLQYIPQELKINGLWCGWKLTDKGKVPFNLKTGEHAKSNDESTFSLYSDMLNNAYKYIRFENNKQLGGIGLGIFRGYSAVDIDHCVNDDGQLSDMAVDIINYFNSYTEYSPSGKGIRIIFKTQNKINKDEYYINNHNIGLEIYISDNTNKFVTITGNRIDDKYAFIKNVDITEILNKYMRKGEFNINKVLEKDEKLKILWNKTAPGAHSDESETDMSLACKLNYYLKDETLIKQYFEMSPYFNSKDDAHLKKWNSGYGIDTIRKAMKFTNAGLTRTAYEGNANYTLSDTGNAHRFVDMFKDEIRYNVDNKMWMLWNGNYWQFDYFNNVKNFVEIMAEKMRMEAFNLTDLQEQTKFLKNVATINSSKGKENLLKESKHLSGIPIMNADLDSNKYLLCCKSKTLDLENNLVRDNRKSDYISKTTAYDIDTENEPVAFVKFLKEMLVDEEVFHFVQKALGYSISDLTREQCMFILEGNGNNGKSLLLDVIATVLGDYAISCNPELITSSDFANKNQEAIARLKGKRFCVIEEINDGDKLNERLVKQLTSGLGKNVARYLYSNSFEFTVTAKIWLATNFDPNVRGVDKGIWRRMVKIPAPSDFTGREDKELRDKLLAEAPQILGWLYKGYLMYKAEGLKQPEAIINATQEFKKDMDLVQQWIDEYCDVGPENFERANILYDSFRTYSQRRDLKTNQTIFGRNMGKKFKKTNSGHGIVYLGVKLRRAEDDIERAVMYEQIEVRKDI